MVINLPRLFKFWQKFLQDFLTLTLIISGLAFLTELLTHLQQLPGILINWQFWLAVGVNMLPSIFTTFLVFFLAARFLRTVYGLKNRREGIDFLARARFGQPDFSPFMRVSDGKITLNEDSILTKVGGPGNLIIFNNSAVVLERAGRLTRVAGPGFCSLKEFETIYDVVDLRPKRWILTVNAMTKEGIDVSWDVEVCYQLADGDQQPTEETPFPCDENAVFRAATIKWRRETGRIQDMDWEGRVVIGSTEGTLRSILARRPLDTLIGLTEAEAQAARESVQAELEAAVRKAVTGLGAKILHVKLDNLKVGDTVTQQWIDAWRATWQKWTNERLGQSEAARIQLYEEAKAEAQMHYITNITRALAQENLSRQDTLQTLSMRLFSVLDRAQLPASARVFVPGQAWEMVNQLQGLAGEAGRRRTPPPPDSPPKILPFKGKDLPVIDQIAAGKAKPVVEDIIGYMRQMDEDIFRFQGVTLKVKNLLKGPRLKPVAGYSYFAMEVVGDSMNQAGISPGDYVIIQKSDLVPVKPNSGDIVVVKFRDENKRATLKRIHFRPDKVVLSPESTNPQNKPQELPHRAFAGDNPPAAVLGIAVAVLEPQP